MNRKLYIGTLLIAIFALFTACGKQPKNTFSSGITTVMCDESFENIISQEIEMFEYHYPKANIMPYYVDEQTAVDSLMDLKTQLIIISNKLSKAHEAQLKLKNRRLYQQRLAVDAIALIVNNKNTLDELSISELRNILLGETKNWDEIEPSKLKKIQVVFDHKHSSIVKYMVDSITGGKPFAGEVYAQQSTRDVIDKVSKNKNTIGLIGVSWITPDMRGRNKSAAEYYQELQKNDTTALDFNDNIKVLKIRRDDYPIAFKPYQAYIFSGEYPLYRSIYVATTAARGSLPHGFLTFLTGYVGQKIIQNTGVLPAAIQPRMVQVN